MGWNKYFYMILFDKEGNWKIEVFILFVGGFYEIIILDGDEYIL